RRTMDPSKSDRKERAEPIANLPFAPEIQIRPLLGIPKRVKLTDDWYYVSFWDTMIVEGSIGKY
ncbi:MAG: hypothetical protein O9352_21175, partial [Rhizobium sp.]|nr:hypothetical protein [Rhizobium sp.]